MSRVLIADHHAVVRARCRKLLEVEPSISEIGEAASGSEALDALGRQNWDLLLMGGNLPEDSGLDILRHVTTRYPSVRVLVMRGLPEQH